MSALSLPSIPKLAGSEFRLVKQTGRNPIATGEHQGAETGTPLWRCSLATTDLSRAIGGEYAWLRAKLRGAMRSIYLFDNARPRPLAYHAGGSWGAPRVVSIDAAASTITFDGFVAGAIISDGDMGAWDDGPTRRLHILAAGVAAGDGTLTVEVEPAPPSSSASLPADFTMEKPCGEFLLLSSSQRFRAPVVQRVEMEALQILRSA